MNKSQKAALHEYTAGHENAIRECALRIQEHIGLVLGRIECGQATSIDHYLRGISMDVQEARILVGVLDGISAGAAFAEKMAKETAR